MRAAATMAPELTCPMTPTTSRRLMNSCAIAAARIPSPPSSRKRTCTRGFCSDAPAFSSSSASSMPRRFMAPYSSVHGPAAPSTIGALVIARQARRSDATKPAASERVNINPRARGGAASSPLWKTKKRWRRNRPPPPRLADLSPSGELLVEAKAPIEELDRAPPGFARVGAAVDVRPGVVEERVVGVVEVRLDVLAALLELPNEVARSILGRALVSKREVREHGRAEVVDAELDLWMDAIEIGDGGDALRELAGAIQRELAAHAESDDTDLLGR